MVQRYTEVAGISLWKTWFRVRCSPPCSDPSASDTYWQWGDHFDKVVGLVSWWIQCSPSVGWRFCIKRLKPLPLSVSLMDLLILSFMMTHSDQKQFEPTSILMLQGNVSPSGDYKGVFEFFLEVFLDGHEWFDIWTWRCKDLLIGKNWYWPHMRGGSCQPTEQLETIKCMLLF